MDKGLQKALARSRGQYCRHSECQEMHADELLSRANFTETWGFKDDDPMVVQAGNIYKFNAYVPCSRITPTTGAE